MKQKKKNKKRQIQKKIIQQHKGKKITENKDAYTNFTSFGDIKAFLLKNIDFLALAATLIFAVYFNSLNGAFISDDIGTYVNAPLIRNIPASFKTLLWQSALYSTYFAVFKLNPIPLHVTSVLMHLVSVILFFMFVSNFYSKRVAMLSTILFSIHPITSEAVSWISGNNYLMFSIIILTTVLTYILYKNSGQNKYLKLSLAIFSMGIITTREIQTLLAFPIVVLVDQFLMEKKINVKSALKLWWYVIPSAAFLIFLKTTISSRIASVGTSFSGSASFQDVPPYSIYMTLRLMFFPDKLTLYHDAEIITQPLFRIMWLVTIFFLISVIILWKKNRKLAGLILIAIVSFSYMMSPVQVAWFFAERYVYFATAIYTLAVVLIFVWLEKKAKIKNLALVLIILLTLAYSVRTIMRNQDWKTRKSLWEATQKVVPYSARAYNNLGDVYAGEGNIEKSIRAFETAIKLKPDYDAAYHNLGLSYLKQKNLVKAEENFKKSLALNPNIFQSYFHLALVELYKENYLAAMQYTKKSLELNPQHEPAILLMQKLQEAVLPAQ